MKAIFLSDFDGTATAKDFYKIVLDAIGPQGWDYVAAHRKTGKVDYHFLNHIFGWLDLTHQAYEALLDTIEIDETLMALIGFLEQHQIEFSFVSAGFDRYILDALQRKGFGQIALITNPGIFQEGRMKMIPDQNSPFYSPVFGIDKGLVVADFKKRYDLVYFAGDTEPDFTAAMAADVVFAKGELIPQLEAANKPFIAFERYEELLPHLKAVLL